MGIFANKQAVEDQQQLVERLKDFIYRHHNTLELADMEDAILVDNIIAERHHQWQPNS